MEVLLLKMPNPANWVLFRPIISILGVMRGLRKEERLVSVISPILPFQSSLHDLDLRDFPVSCLAVLFKT